MLHAEEKNKIESRLSDRKHMSGEVLEQHLYSTERYSASGILYPA